MANDIDITDGQRTFAFINGTFVFGDFIEALIVKNNWLCKRLVASTLSFNDNNVDSFRNLIDGDFVRKLDIIVSYGFYEHERFKLIKYAYDELDIKNIFQLAIIENHTKGILIETDCGKKITIHGSANLRSSGSIEQICIETDSSVFDFFAETFDFLIDRYKTIKNDVIFDCVDKSEKETKSELRRRIRSDNDINLHFNSDKK